MTLSGISHYESSSLESLTTADIILSTEQDMPEIYMLVDDISKTMVSYTLSISEFSFHKKMYQATEVIADITIAQSSGDASNYQEIGRKNLEETFKHAQVSLTEGDFSIGDDFYVHEVLPHYKSNSMLVTLKIYSLDKLLTVKESCRTFVGKRLSQDILKKETIKYIKPWTIERDLPAINKQLEKMRIATQELKDEIRHAKAVLNRVYTPKKISTNILTKEQLAEKEQALKTLQTEQAALEKTRNDKIEKQKNISSNTTNMQILQYSSSEEHIFPFLVQYNESFYDMLARTTNRWGEFLYYENGALNIGYNPKATPIAVDKAVIQDISYGDLNAKRLALATDGRYDYVADSSSLDPNPIRESPNYVKAQMGAFGGEADKWIMNQFSSIFMNDKNLPTMMGNMLFDNMFNLAKEESKEAKRNAKHNKKYFANFDETSPQYSKSYHFKRDHGEDVQLRAFQEFTEINTSFTGWKYKTILEKEQAAGRDAIYINYGTTHPHVLLGSIITFKDENFIVVEVTGGFDADRHLVFQVVATAQDQDKLFYPAVIPAGHVRYAHPQIATISDATDPTKVHRVRVLFSWQDSSDDPTPWLTFASGQQGHAMAGKHYVDDRVMVGFEDGNVERPYVIGGLVERECDQFNIDSVVTSQGMHQLVLTDGSGAGMQSFLAGAISPLTKTLMGFAPGLIPSWKWDKDKYFEGGFELTDNYGTYKISGSTDGRNVSIASNWGDVKINAFTGISISAPNGDVSITGKNVSIKAGNNLTIESGTNVGYKLFDQWTLQDGTVDKRVTAENILSDISIPVAKRLAEVAMNVFDLSLVRSAVEIFFRPVEGCLSLKSNRFLKLAAGENTCQYPNNVYKLDEKVKMDGMLIDVNFIPELQKVFQVIPTVCENLIEKYKHIYSLIVDSFDNDETSFEADIHELRAFANDAHGEICKSYDDLKEELWSQDKDEDWGEEKLGFTDNVAIKGKPEEIVTPNCFLLSVVNDIVGDKAKREEAILNRKRNRKSILNHYNDLRKYIYDLTHLEPTKKNISQWFGHINGKKVPKDYQEKLLTAFSKQKCSEAFCYKTPKGISRVDLAKRLQIDVENEKKYLRRVVTMNFLEELGFTEAMRWRVANNPDYPLELPPMPQADNKDASNETSIMNDLCWANYVNSLSVIPPLDMVAISGAMAGPVANSGLLGAQKDKMMFWKDVPEIKTWRSGNSGRILLGSGDIYTYALNGDRLEKVDTKDPSLSSMLNSAYGSYIADVLQLFTEKIGKTLIKM